MVEEIKLFNTILEENLIVSMSGNVNYVLEYVDWGTISGSNSTYKYLNQIGESVTNTTLGTRDIIISGWIIASTDSEMTQRKAVLNKFVNPRNLVTLTYKDFELDFLPSSSIKYGNKIAENNEVIVKFRIDGFCADPLFRDVVENRVIAANVIPMFHFPLIISKEPDPPGGIVFGFRRPSLIVNVNNSGSVRTGMRIVFQAKDVVVNPILTNVITGEFFKINKTLSAGEIITVDTNIGQKSILGTLSGVTTNYFKYMDLDSEWLQLVVGDNLFRYDAEENLEDLDVYIYFDNRYLEVQECY